ncbi:MAG: T9SS type A sorting domain-containing protein [Lewinellaceae bacterium]|nr:T9SS type A sorting domain-containing protein [Lewinellaceae bacterium]
MKSITCFLMLFAAVIAQAQPTTSAPVPPTRNPSDVISIYGEAYTNITNVNYNPGWGQSGTVNISFDPGDGNLAMAYTNFNYQGTGFEANPQNASAMEFVHIDIWTSNATVVKFTPIDNSGMGPSEVLVDVPVSTGQWSSVDLPKSAFTGMSWNSVFQLKFDANAGVTPCDIYLDNIYFWKPGSDPASDATLSDLQVDGATITGFAPSAFTYAYGVPGGSSVPQVTLATPNNQMATVTSITQATSIPGDATVLVTASNGTTTATYTISYFYNSPATAAPTPTNTNVISLFSDAYTDVNVDNWTTSWSQAVYVEDTIAGNPTKKYTLLGFNGIETTSEPVDATGMTYLHLDVWTPNITMLNVKLVSFLGDGFMGANGDSEANLNLNPTLGEWNQYHIPLADFTNAGLTGLDDLNQYIFTSTPFGSGILFLDNVYFTTEIVDVDDLANSKHKVILYPNPVSADANLYLTSEVTTVEIFNLSGQRVLTTNQSAINLQGLETGIYLVKVTDPDGVVHTNKLMVK